MAQGTRLAAAAAAAVVVVDISSVVLGIEQRVKDHQG